MGKKVLAIIPARGGSKGLPRKNIKELEGKHLIGYAIEGARGSKYIDRVIVSTEDSEIAQISKMYGAEVPYLRPQILAGDSSLIIDVVLNMLEYLSKNEGYIPYYVLLLQATSPLRTSIHIDEAIEKLLASKYDGIVSVCEAEINPYWTNIFVGDKLEYFLEAGKLITKRQDLPLVYRNNGAIYMVKTEELINKKTFEIENITGYIMDRESSIDIDTSFDFKLAKLIMESRRI